MAVTIAQIEAEILEELGNHPELTPSVVRRLLLSANRIVLGAETPWHQEPTEVSVVVKAPTTNADATVTLDSPTVASSSAAASMVGQFFRRGSDEEIFEITAQSAGVSLTIENDWPFATASAQTYTTFTRFVTPATDGANIIEVWVGGLRLDKRDLVWLNRHDPARQSTTENVPSVWVDAVRSSTDVPRFELWPLPTAATVIRVYYERSGDIIGEGARPLYPSHLLTLRGMASCATRIASTTNTNAAQQWLALARGKYVEYKEELDKAILENRSRLDAKQRVSPPQETVPTDFAITHDVWGF